MPISSFLIVLNLAATWYMAGLIWFVQLVHYPQFAMVGDKQFRRYHPRHARFTTLAVGPPMLLEAVTAVGLLFSWSACFGSQPRSCRCRSTTCWPADSTRGLAVYSAELIGCERRDGRPGGC